MDVLQFIGFFEYDGLLDENPTDYRWDDKKKLFVNTITGKTLTARQMRELIDEISQYLIESVQDLSEIPTIERTTEYWDAYLVATLSAFMLGAGGLGNYDTGVQSAMETILAEQAGYFNRFLAQIQNGELSLAQVKDRFRLYAQSLRQTYERARVFAYNPTLVLPAYPGGVTCGSNCKCHLTVREFTDRWEVRWIRTATESCSDCLYYSGAWTPYVVYKV